MAYICSECGSKFEEPSEYKEDYGECFGSYVPYRYKASPCCAAAYEEEGEVDIDGESN